MIYAYNAIREWLGRRHELVAAVTMGIPDESPAARSRLPRQELTEWRE